MATRAHRLVHRLRDGVRSLAEEFAKFGLVGGVAYVVDVGLFNLLRFAGSGVLEDRPLTAKVISVSAAMLVAWLGNRYWTFRRRGRGAVGREVSLFVLMNIIGMGIALACLAVSHYVLGFTSALADNIAANVVGMALGTAFRFVAYRNWVFTGNLDPDQLALSRSVVPSVSEPVAGGAAGTGG